MGAPIKLELIYEWGDDLEDERETVLEFYAGENTSALGPVLMGTERLGTMKALRWEGGVVFGLDSDTPDYILRVVLEYEF